ncbi:MAG: HIT family protein [Candidatus Microsyncoccus archaeolyticus]|jgi:histidine triad (HIT) family protein|nr:MAG: HIT family protein [Candidatus Parcubacteria bacterium]
MDNCIFCKIINNEIPSYKIYEDDLVLAFLDINPVVLGHTLIIPKKHFDNICEIEDNYLERIIVVSKKISLKMKETLGVEGINLYQANGSVAGQTVFHFHLHVLGRNSGDGLKGIEEGAKRVPVNNLEEIKNKLKLC